MEVSKEDKGGSENSKYGFRHKKSNILETNNIIKTYRSNYPADTKIKRVFKRSIENPDLTEFEERYQKVAIKFEQTFNKKPQRITKIPAIVKFPVDQLLPLLTPALYVRLERETLIGVSEGDSTQHAKRIHIFNNDKSKHLPVKFLFNFFL